MPTGGRSASASPAASCRITSPRRRPASFLTAKVADYIRALRTPGADDQVPPGPLRIGNLAVNREWGFAPDHVDGMIRVCRQIAVRANATQTPVEADVGSNYRDYVLGTGRRHAVWELIHRAFLLAGCALVWDRSSSDPVDWTASLEDTGAPAVVVDASFIRNADPAIDRNGSVEGARRARVATASGSRRISL